MNEELPSLLDWAQGDREEPPPRRFSINSGDIDALVKAIPVLGLFMEMAKEACRTETYESSLSQLIMSREEWAQQQKRRFGDDFKVETRGA